MLSSPRRPSSTMRIFSSAENCRRVARRMSFTTFSAGSFTGPDFCLIFAPHGYDEPEILPSENHPICLTGADVGQPGLNNAARAQERRADGGDNGAGPDGSAAPVAAAFRWPVSLVEREGIGESGRNGRAGNRAPRTDRSVDHRRHWFSQERPTLGLRGTPVLRSAREAGELPSGGVAVTRQSPREPAGRLASLSTERVGGRP